MKWCVPVDGAAPSRVDRDLADRRWDAAGIEADREVRVDEYHLAVRLADSVAEVLLAWILHEELERAEPTEADPRRTLAEASLADRRSCTDPNPASAKLAGGVGGQRVAAGRNPENRRLIVDRQLLCGENALIAEFSAEGPNRRVLLVRTEIGVREEHAECRLRERPFEANLIDRNAGRRRRLQAHDVEGQQGIVGYLGEIRAAGVPRAARVEKLRPRCRNAQSRRLCAGNREESDQRPRYYPPSTHHPIPHRLVCLPGTDSPFAALSERRSREGTPNIMLATVRARATVDSPPRLPLG